MRRRHTLVGFLCVLLAVGIARTQEPEPPRPLQPPELAIELDDSGLKVRGAVSSAANKAILHQTGARLFDGRNSRFELDIQPALPPGWALMTDITLQAVAETRSAIATISANGIIIRGVTADSDRWNEAASRIRRNIVDGMTFQEQIEEVRPAGPMNRQCVELFRTALRGRRIEFPQASAELGTAASPLLDELIQIAADCPTARVEITGHTDSTGIDAVNRTLSLARAQAVAAYMIAGGIAAGRINAAGAGSSRPLVAENNAQARQLNRRIDIEIGF